MKNNKVQVKKGGWLESEIEIDAKIVLCAMRWGMDGIMDWGIRNLDIFPTVDKLMERVNGLKKQAPMYIQAVSERAAELEIKYPSIVP